MPEFSNYVEGLDAAATTTGTILIPASHDGGAEKFTPAQILAAAGGGGGAVDSVNGETGVVVLSAADVGADPAGSASTVAGNLSAHISDATDAHAGTAITNTPAGSVSATTVQGAINELDTEKQALANSAAALTDASSMALTAIKHTLTTSSATRTFTISYTGDDITLEVTLNGTSSVFTFPATTLCVSEGVASGDNTCNLAGSSGDRYLIAIKKIGSNYRVVCKNFLQ